MWGVSPTEAMLPVADKNGLAVIAETTIKESTVGKNYVIRAARTGDRISKAQRSFQNSISSHNKRALSVTT